MMIILENQMTNNFLQMNYHSLTPVAPWRHKRKLKNVLKYEIICKLLYFELKKKLKVWEIVVFPIIHLLLLFFLVFKSEAFL